MTQPTSVDATFDTSLIDLNPNASFSTTESDPSDLGPSSLAGKISSTQQLAHSNQQRHGLSKLPHPLPSEGKVSSETWADTIDKTQVHVQHVPTQDAYDQWAHVYDSDGNMLQSIDDIEVAVLLSEMFSHMSTNVQAGNISLLDLGCGTGRSTAKLFSHLHEVNKSSILGLDFSRAMLDVATEKLSLLVRGANGRVTLRLECCDCFPTICNPSASPLPVVTNFSPANAAISTLVLEHIPLDAYFTTLSTLVLPGGMALITNMHADMGRVSQAGFINAQGVKIRGKSFAHTVGETVNAAKNAGFTVITTKERKMTNEDIESGMVGERGRKWVGVNVWYGILLEKNSVQ